MNYPFIIMCEKFRTLAERSSLWVIKVGNFPAWDYDNHDNYNNDTTNYNTSNNNNHNNDNNNANYNNNDKNINNNYNIGKN